VAHLMAAFRYLALNPVKAKRAATPADWPWSSTPAHFRREDDRGKQGQTTFFC
jgi:putative transposase